MDQLLLDRLTEALETNLQNEQFGVPELAEASGLSKSQLNRRLQTISGQSSSQFIREYRLKRAMELLKNKAATPTEVAYKVGFGSPSYFSTCFKAFYGYSPNEVKYKEKGIPKITKNFWKNYSMLALGVILILSITYFSFSKLLSSDRAKDKSRSQIRIAVLPVKNYNSDSSSNIITYYFSDDITGKLSKINEFAVIENSFAQNMNVREIGSVLNVDYLLGVSFVPTDKKFKLMVKITRANDGTVIWLESYQRTLKDLQDIQNEVVFTIAKKLGVNVTSLEAKQINEKLTHSDTAYNYYLVGSDFLSRLQTEENMRIASNLFEKAVELDSGFAKAWLGLYSANRVIYGRYYERSEVQYQKVQQYFEKARSLNPELLQIKIDLSEEMDEYEQLLYLKNLLPKYPGNDTIYKKISGIYRNLGEKDSALYYVEKAIEFNPIDFHHWIMAGVYHWGSRRYNKALACYFRALELKPTLKIPHPAYLYVEMGELENAREYLTELVEEDKRHKKDLSYIEYLDRNFNMAISLMDEADSITNNFHSQYRTKSLELGLIYYAMGDMKSARVQFERAHIHMNKMLEEFPDDPRVLSSLGIVYAGIGLKKEAIKTVQKAVHTAGRVDRLNYLERDLALVCVIVGEYGQSLKQLKYLTEKGLVGVWELKLDPIWDPLRDKEAFKDLINNPDYQPVL